MPTIPVFGIRLFDPDQTSSFLGYRFRTHLARLRHGVPAEAKTLNRNAIELMIREFSDDDIDKIDRRVERLIKARAKLRSVGHLKTEDRAALQVLAGGAKLVSIPSEHRADEIAAELHADMPWMGPANEMVWHAMRRSVREGWAGLRLPPMLLDGPPGIGKSHWARRLGEMLSTPVLVVEAANESASFRWSDRSAAGPAGSRGGLSERSYEPRSPTRSWWWTRSRRRARPSPTEGMPSG